MNKHSVVISLLIFFLVPAGCSDSVSKQLNNNEMTNKSAATKHSQKQKSQQNKIIRSKNKANGYPGAPPKF